MLGALVLAQWIAVAFFAISTRHNGWLFYQGGDQTAYYTTAWVLSDRELPVTPIGYGWPLALSPIAAWAGANYIAALPAIVLAQFALLLPIAVLCVFALAARLGGRRFGYVAAGFWVAVPYLCVPLFVERYHERYVEQVLPQSLGLTGMADFPSMVALLVAAVFCFRALDRDAPADAILAAFAFGVAAGIKPANLLFLAGPALAFLVARRFRQLLVPFAAALLPALFTLALWKSRGLGSLPAFASGATPETMGLGGPLGRYLQIDFAHLYENFRGLREFFWSGTLLVWLGVAGTVGAWRRSPPKAALLLGWLGAFVLFKGSTAEAAVDSGSLFRLLMPAFPAFLLLAVCIPFCLPALGPRLWRHYAPEARSWFRARDSLLIEAAAIFVVLPALVIVAVEPLHGARVAKDLAARTFISVDNRLALEAEPRKGGTRLSWSEPPTGKTRVFYRLYRSPPVFYGGDPTLPPAIDGIRCVPGRRYVPDCFLEMSSITTTRRLSLGVDSRDGEWVYRVGMAANWADDEALGDVLMLGPPLRVASSPARPREAAARGGRRAAPE